MREVYQAYVDGSYNKDRNILKWGYIVIDDDRIIAEDLHAVQNHRHASGWQIAGELMAAAGAARWSKENHTLVTINYDYIGIYQWVIDLFEPNKKAWKTKNDYVREYRKEIESLQDYIHSFNHTPSHTGIVWNERIDKMVGAL